MRVLCLFQLIQSPVIEVSLIDKPQLLSALLIVIETACHKGDLNGDHDFHIRSSPLERYFFVKHVDQERDGN